MGVGNDAPIGDQGPSEDHWNFSLRRISYLFYGENILLFHHCRFHHVLFWSELSAGFTASAAAPSSRPFSWPFSNFRFTRWPRAALAGTFITSVFGVVLYQFIVPWFSPSGNAGGAGLAPGFFIRSWRFGRHLLRRPIAEVHARDLYQMTLFILIVGLALRYIIQFWRPGA
jgi:hypothetical protein